MDGSNHRPALRHSLGWELFKFSDPTAKGEIVEGNKEALPERDPDIRSVLRGASVSISKGSRIRSRGRVSVLLCSTLVLCTYVRQILHADYASLTGCCRHPKAG